MLVAVITNLEQIEPSLPFAQILEYRLDFLKEIRINRKLPALFTFRKKEQGGVLAISEKKRLSRLEAFLELGPDYCDLEADTDPVWIEKLKTKFPNIHFIGSYHNFSEMPADLESLFASMQNPHFSTYKIAARAASTLDMLRLMKFAGGKKNLAWISMGKEGQPSRILAPITGSPFCYANLGEEKAPLFQIDLQTLVHLYRLPSLNEKTKIFALIGDPIEASAGHLFHNEVFGSKKEMAVYVKLRVLPEELDPLFKFFRQLPFVGLSVTMPHKTAVIPFLDLLDEDAKKIGAVNTIYFKKGKAIGFNTDGEGAADALELYLPLKKKKIALLGAGGAARAIAYELTRRGSQVKIFNRTYEKAKTLANCFGASAGHFEELYTESFDLLINAIPYKGEFPIDLGRLHFPPYVMDIVRGLTTPLLEKAKERGCHAIDANEMFIRQARLQQKIWHNL